MKIVLGGLDDPRVVALLALHLDAMRAHSPPGTAHALDVTRLRTPDISFWTAWDGDEAIGCGALREIGAEHGEIKSMRTHPAHLRKGVGAVLLDTILATARSRGYHMLSLETGSGRAFEPALALYRRYGFEEGAPFGGYAATDFNRFYHLSLK